MRPNASLLAVVAVLCAGACGDAPSTTSEAGSHAPPSGAAERPASLAAFDGLEGTLSIAGGTAHIPVMEKAAALVEEHFPGIRITIAGGGSGVGIQQAGEGLVDIGNSGRPLSDAEVSTLGLVPVAFAIDGVAVVVHPDNPVADLTGDQVRALFAGEVTDWAAVGGPVGPVNLYTRDEASGTRAVFWKALLEKGPIVDRAVVVTSNGAMKTAVAGDLGALGYVSIGHVDETLRPVSLDGVAPNQENAASGAYPVTRMLYSCTKGPAQGLAGALLDLLFSPEGEAFVRAAGYIPVSRR